ncbi:metal ion transporter metal ion transporter [Colletotrichum graminicola]|uniref:Metal ion transporter metal ion transporter n=1 Tax=Colletotrichum graminicola (strain M1.001 / M2 / FGSC 10212) TaxID=645133 RepID=E3QSR7_COLGM|nr:metal ion transporter metal ion transporter [Colletotrichum graminicola M1.001]EFQ33905.1 metal ion transporter metal ion transporter [Colletotrichum graminicola M1.001]WDK19524.1 metal ion transporter metal ion transporter [Colletotrichum graminicola]
MNRPSRTDEPYEGEGYNQSPNPLSNDLTTNQDLNGTVNARVLEPGEDGKTQSGAADNAILRSHDDWGGDRGAPGARDASPAKSVGLGHPGGEEAMTALLPTLHSRRSTHGGRDESQVQMGIVGRIKSAVIKFGSFIGPGFMISVAYIDPGNYSTGVAAGATYRFRLLFVVLLSNLFAIFLQSLCTKLGTVTGLNLAEACRAFLPRWLNYVLYAFAEIAIIATDIAEVIGFAIGLNLLIPAIPLVAGCAISILDVMIILIFYRPHGSMKGLRMFEFFVVGLVLAVVVCFCIQLSLIRETSVREVFQGYLPSHAVVESQGLYQACGILGATVMPHSLYLGSGIVQARLREYDTKHDLLPPEAEDVGFSSDGIDKGYYVPSAKAIKHCLATSIAELGFSLFTFALFVNSAIVVVAGASIYGNKDAADADIFSIHKLLTDSISQGAGTVFALALLLSGVSAGIVCTIAGQMVSEGALRWKMRPWLRRLVTRSISVTPSIVIAAAIGREGVSDALNASQVVLSVVLPFITAPLIYFTCRNKYMTVRDGAARFRNQSDEESMENTDGLVKMANSWYTAIFAVLVWVIIAAMNVANLVLL